MLKQAEAEKHKKNKKKKDHHGQPTMVHINLVGSTIAVDATKLRDPELEQLLEVLAVKAKTRNQHKRKELDNKEKEQVKFLNKCRYLVQCVIPGPIEVETDKPLERAYELFESMVSVLQEQI